MMALPMKRTRPDGKGVDVMDVDEDSGDVEAKGKSLMIMDDELSLICRNPNSAPDLLTRKVGAVFSVHPANVTLDCGHYDIIGVASRDVKYKIVNFNDERFALTFPRIDCTLYDWLNCHNTISAFYKNINVKRPTDATRHVIRGILTSYDMYRSVNAYHGDLDELRNYGLKFHKNSNFNEDNGYCEVHLLNLKKCNNPPSGNEDPRIKDVKDITELIFGKLLPGSISEYPLDIQDLHKLLTITKKEDTGVRRDVNDIFNDLSELIVDHTSMWFYMRRYFYLIKVAVIEKEHRGNGFTAQSIVQSQMLRVNPLRGVTNTLGANNWCAFIRKTRITNAVMYKCMQFKKYKPDRLSFYDFLRNFNVHVGDIDNTGARCNFTDMQWCQMKFVECQVSNVFPYHLVDLHPKLKRQGIIA